MTTYFDFNDQLVRKLPAPARGGYALHRDAQVPGLLLRITSGKRSWCIEHWDSAKGRSLRYTLGNALSMSTAEARKAVAVRKGNLAVGRSDPFMRVQQKNDAVTLRRVFDDYLRDKELKPRTVADYRYRVEVEGFPTWLKNPLSSISRNDVERRYRKIASERSPSRARGAMIVLRALFRFAMDRYEADGKPLVLDNPVRVMNRTKGWTKQRRKHTSIPLKLMPAWFRAAVEEGSLASDYLRLVAYTGLRRSEAAGLKWSDINLRAGYYTVSDRKNDDVLRLPITRQLAAIFKKRAEANKEAPSLYVFPALTVEDAPLAEPRKALNRICAVIDYPSTVHDLRRSFVGAADASGLPFGIVKLLVGHRLPSASDDVTHGYLAPDSQRLLHAAQVICDLLDGTTKRGAK